MKTIILDNTRIERIIRRIALQIMEHCYQEKRITIIGMQPRGTWVAKQITEALRDMSNVQVDTLEIDTDALEGLSTIADQIKGRSVILIDDVIKSGHTMMIAASAVMQYKPNVLMTAALVDRKHRRFPIQCDLTGLSLATTIQEHIRLEIKPKPKIYLE